MYCVAFQGQRDRNPNHWYICCTGEATDEQIDYTVPTEELAYVYLQEMKRYHSTTDYKVMNYETVKMLNELTGDFNGKY